MTVNKGDERERARAAEGALDRIHEPDAAEDRDQQFLSQLGQLQREVATGVEDLRSRLDALLDQYGQQVMDSHGKRFAARFAGQSEPFEVFPRNLWFPSEARPSWVTHDRLYSLQWTDTNTSPGLVQNMKASMDTGGVQVTNVALAQATLASGWASASVGIQQVQPKHPITSLTFRPDVEYLWLLNIDQPPEVGHIRLQGQVRLAVERWDPKAGTFHVHHSRDIELFFAQSITGPAVPIYDKGSGSLASDPGITFIETSSSELALSVMARVLVDKVDQAGVSVYHQDRAASAVGIILMTVPMILLDEVKV